MDKINDSKIIDDSSKFVTTNHTKGSKFSSMVSEKFSQSIFKRRNGQYIAGEIIAIFSIRDSVNEKGILKHVIDKDIKTHFLILSNKFQRNYLVCPLFSRTLLNSTNFEPYEINVGIIPEIEKNRILYADISRCHFISKDEFHTFVINQRKLMIKEGEEAYVFRLPKSAFHLVIKGYKSMLNS